MKSSAGITVPITKQRHTNMILLSCKCGVDFKSSITDRWIHSLVLLATTLAHEIPFWFQDGACVNKIYTVTRINLLVNTV